MLIGLSTTVTYVSARTSNGIENGASLMRNNESQYVTAVDKPMTVGERSTQFDQTLSLRQESLARARLCIYVTKIFSKSQ